MKIEGTFYPPGDKSISHRIALLSLISRGVTNIENFSNARDCMTSLRIVCELGGDVKIVPPNMTITGIDRQLKTNAFLDCENSGTTIRLLMGLLSPNSGEFLLDGDHSLRNRPMERVALPLRKMGANIICGESGKPPVKIMGSKLQGTNYELPIPSAQLKSAVLLAGVQADGKTCIAEKFPSRNHTEILLASYGADIEKTPYGWSVGQSSLIMPGEYYVPGDISSACFFICAAAIVPGSMVTARKVLLNPTRTGALNVLQRIGADIEVSLDQRMEDIGGVSHGEIYGDVVARFSGELKPFEVTAEETPSLVDEMPILALVATQAKGVSIFHDVSELKIKESDRVQAVVSQLTLMGAKLETRGTSLHIQGPTKLVSKTNLKSFGDHRIAMTLKIAGLISNSFPNISDEECIAISYPNFNDTLRSLVK